VTIPIVLQILKFEISEFLLKLTFISFVSQVLHVHDYRDAHKKYVFATRKIFECLKSQKIHNPITTPFQQGFDSNGFLETGRVRVENLLFSHTHSQKRDNLTLERAQYMIRASKYRLQNVFHHD
jgi:hypothetical protein